MEAVSDILLTPGGVCLRLGAMLLMLFQIYLLLRVILQKRSAWCVLLFALHVLGGLCLLTLLLDRAYRLDYLSYVRTYPAAVLWVGSLPWAAVAGAETLSALLCALGVRNVAAYARSHPGRQSVKQTVDLLPTGLCVAAEDGLILLSNLRMNACNAALTGSSYSGADALWQAAQEQGEPQDGKLLVRLPDDTAILMEKTGLELNGRRLVQITAEDVTEPYRMTAELTEKNARLRALQQRLKDYRLRQTELVIRQELLAARTTIHNQLGGALLTGKYHLEHPDNADAETLRLLLRHINTYLLSEAEEPESGADLYESALQTAAGFGVAVEVTGEIPEKGPLRLLLAQAVAECALNTVKHAGGDRLFVTVDKNSCTVTNNGNAPTAEIEPIGGLLSLRLAAEQAGGSMTLESLPRFCLTIALP